MLSPSEQQKMNEFQMEEARWLDSVVRPLIPEWMRWVVEKNKKNIIGRIGHFLVDYFYIRNFLGISITRSQDTTVLGGKGFRQGIDHGYRIDQVRVTVFRKKTEIAKQNFKVGLIVKNNQ